MSVSFQFSQNVLNALARFNQQPITKEQGQKLAQRIHAHCYLECSALTQVGLAAVFEQAVRGALAESPSLASSPSGAVARRGRGKSSKRDCLLI